MPSAAKTTRRATVAATLITGGSQREAAKQVGISQVAVCKQAKIIPPLPALDELIVQFATELFNANIALCKMLQDPNYVLQQSANDVGVLAGILNDKAGRIIDALGRRRQE